MTGAAVVLAALALGVAAPSANAAYTGSVDTGGSSATLTGGGPVALSTGGGLVHHGDLGPGFASDADFDSSAPGDQTVPDTGGWTLTATGSGSDNFDIQEGEATSPVFYASGHTFFPGGVPCMVRDPVDRGGAIAFSIHREAETRLCYQAGFRQVSVRGGTGTVEFTVLDTEPGVPLALFGGPGDDSASEAANVPSSVAEFHNPESAVAFSGGAGSDYLSFNDGRATTPAKYTIADGAIRRSGLQPLTFDNTVEGLALYPQEGPSDITIGRTGGASVQVFGDFFGQKGPDTIDARGADAAAIVSGSTGDDKIFGSAFSDFLGSGGGNDTIDSRDTTVDNVRCDEPSGTVKADTLDQVMGCPSGGSPSKPLIALWRAAFTPKKVKRGKPLTLDAVSTATGKVTLKFERGGHRAVSKKVSVKPGPNTLKFRVKGLPKGRYSVSAQLRATSGKSKVRKLGLTIR